MAQHRPTSSDHSGDPAERPAAAETEAGRDVPPGAVHPERPGAARAGDAYSAGPTPPGPARDPAIRSGSATRWALFVVLALAILAMLWFLFAGMGTDVPPPDTAAPPPPGEVTTPGQDPGAPPVAEPQTLPMTEEGVAPPAEEGGPTTAPLPGADQPAQPQ